MEVFHHCLPVEAFHASCAEVVTDNEQDDLDFNDQCSMADVFHRLFSSITCVNTSTPVTAGTSNDNCLNDSGFSDCFSSDVSVSQLSNLYLNAIALNGCDDSDDELPCPKMCLMSKLDDSDDEDTDYLADKCHYSGLSTTSNCSIVVSDSQGSHAKSSESLDLQLPVKTSCELSSCQSPLRDRHQSSARRFRSPAPVIERRSRHRLSLDSYTECCSLDSTSDSPMAVLSIDSLHNKCDIASVTHQFVKESYSDNICSLVHLTLAEFAPPSLDQLIGRKMGLDTVDIVFELMNRSMNVVVDKICNFVAASDLCRLCMVSRTWQAAVNSNKFALNRKEMYIHSQCRKLTLHKQNVPLVQECQQQLLIKTSQSSRVPLLDVQPGCCVSKVLQNGKQPSLAQRFWQEASKLRRDERLAKCARCSGPSRVDGVQERATCTDLSCQYDFCTRCLSAFHGASNCPSAPRPSRRSEPCIGSRQSHRNLRRL